MVKSLLDYYAYTKSYLILKSKNVIKFHVHIRPIFSCRVTNHLMPGCSLIPKSYSLFPYFFVALLNSIPSYLPFEFLIFYHSSLFAFYSC